MAVVVTVAVVGARAQAWEKDFNDPTSGVNLAKLVMCNDCKSASGQGCDDGTEMGWLNGKPCGKCMIESNYGVTIRYPYDLHFIGQLTDAAGEVVKDRFVKIFLPNGWGVRTRTNDKGAFRMTMGATAERQSKEAVIIDLGSHVDSVKGEDPHFAFYMLPEGYKACPADTVIEEPKKTGSKKSSAKKGSGSDKAAPKP